MKKSRILVILVLIFFITITINIKPCKAIKIGLQTGVSSSVIGTSAKGAIVNGFNNKIIMELSARKPYTIKKDGNNLGVLIAGETYSLGTNFIVIKNYYQGFVSAKKKWYRGELYIYNHPNGIIVVNSLPLEEYLLGVVPSEMPSKWNFEAHKAQAIAARSYAVANLGKRKKYGYDLKDTPEDQAYGGASKESTQTNMAVMSTAGIVLVHGNKVIPAFYCASAGGYTVNSGDVWVKDLPYLKSVPSFDDSLPKMGHGIGMSQHGANKMANLGYNAYQILGYFYRDVKLYKINGTL